VNVGDSVETMVLNLDVARKRISLGLKQVEPNPWDIIEEKYPVGTVIEGKIKNITDFGIFIGIDEGIDGLVHISDISWTVRIKHPSEVYKKGQEVQAVVLNIDKENERFSLGVKQLTLDPWDEIPERYKPGTRVTGTVTNVTDFGIFVELEEGIEGLVHISEISADRRGNPLSQFQVDDVIQAKVLNVSRKDKKIGLSIRKLDETSEKDIFKSYLDNPLEATSNLGTLLREEMMNLQQQQGESTEPGEPQEVQSSEEAKLETGARAEVEDSPSEESAPEEIPSASAESQEIEASEPEPETRDETVESPSGETSEEVVSGSTEPQEVGASQSEPEIRDETVKSPSGEALEEDAPETTEIREDDPSESDSESEK
jgi:small subunit ribosomal protein S1